MAAIVVDSPKRDKPGSDGYSVSKAVAAALKRTYHSCFYKTGLATMTPPQDPLQSFRFCPQCGQLGLEIRQARSLLCPACGFRYFINCAAAVAGFVFHGDNLLLTVRAEDPQKGRLDLPGGFVEYDETADEALHREVMEELGVQINDLAYLTTATNNYLYAGVLYKVMDVVFTCRADDISQIRAQDDVSGYRLIAPHALDPAELAFAASRQALATLLQRL